MSDIPKTYSLTYHIKRYPSTNNKSLKGWSAVDEFILWYIEKNNHTHSSKLIINDSFGCLTTHLAQKNTFCVYNLKSQYSAILQNLQSNQIEFDLTQFITPLDNLNEKVDLAILKIPKSLELFELYMQQLSKSLTLNGTLICGFMTKHFSPQLLKISSTYFQNINQTKAWKKSRLIILSNPTQKDYGSQIRLIKSKYGNFSQYKGVFSSGHIDYATQFLIQNIDIPQNTQTILDLASGNGVLAKVVSKKLPNATIHLVDDSFLAIESSKLNLSGEQLKFHHNYNLDEFSDNYFDYIISNPPFHLEHEIDLSLPTNLFKQACRVLKPNGIFELVANRHLMYKPILNHLFKTVEIKAQNSKFIVYKCSNYT
jgi:16S rRNA G1207 methylase RsmC